MKERYPGKPPRGGHLLTQRARAMRREPTAAENRLSQRLRDRQLGRFKFRRQVRIGDDFIADFLCPELMLIGEADGYSHVGKEEYDAPGNWLSKS